MHDTEHMRRINILAAIERYFKHQEGRQETVECLKRLGASERIINDLPELISAKTYIAKCGHTEANEGL